MGLFVGALFFLAFDGYDGGDEPRAEEDEETARPGAAYWPLARTELCIILAIM